MTKKENIKLEFFNISEKKEILILCAIITLGLIIRLSFLNYELPLTLDAEGYFWYAIDMKILGHIPDYPISNNGWPIFLSMFFGLVDSNNPLDYMFLQRISTISLSLGSIVTIFFLCKRFFSSSISLVGALIFAIEPRIIQNSISGLAEPLNIFLISLALLFLINKKFQYWSFVVIGLSTLVRSESIFLFMGFLLITFISQKKNRKLFYKLIIFSLIFFVIISPMLYLRSNTMGSDGVFSRISAGVNVINYENKNLETYEQYSYFSNGMMNYFKLIGWFLAPIFLLFIPIAIFKIFKDKKSEFKNLLVLFMMYQPPIIYAFLRTIEETKYFLPTIPILIILCLFAINFLSVKIRYKKLFYFSLIGSFLISSFILLYMISDNPEIEGESLEIAKYVTKNSMKVNALEPVSKYLTVTHLLMIENFPILGTDMPPTAPIVIVENQNSWENYIDYAVKDGVTHIIVDNNKKNPKFLTDIFYNEDKFLYLKKVFDSNELRYKYKVKIFEIDMEKYFLSKE